MRKPLLPENASSPYRGFITVCLAFTVAVVFLPRWHQQGFDLHVETSVGSVFGSDGAQPYSKDVIDELDLPPGLHYEDENFPCLADKKGIIRYMRLTMLEGKELEKGIEKPKEVKGNGIDPKKNPTAFILKVKADTKGYPDQTGFKSKVNKAIYGRAHYIGARCAQALWEAICGMENAAKIKAKYFMFRMTYGSLDKIPLSKKNNQYLKWGDQPANSNMIRWGFTKNNWQIQDGFDPVVQPRERDDGLTFDQTTRDWLRLMAYVSDHYDGYTPCMPKMQYVAKGKQNKYLAEKVGLGLQPIRWESTESYKETKGFEYLDPPKDALPGGNIQSLLEIVFYSSGKLIPDGAKDPKIVSDRGGFSLSELEDGDKNLFLNAYWERSFLTHEDKSGYNIQHLARRGPQYMVANLEHTIANFKEQHP